MRALGCVVGFTIALSALAELRQESKRRATKRALLVKSLRRSDQLAQRRSRVSRWRQGREQAQGQAQGQDQGQDQGRQAQGSPAAASTSRQRTGEWRKDTALHDVNAWTVTEVVCLIEGVATFVIGVNLALGQVRKRKFDNFLMEVGAGAIQFHLASRMSNQFNSPYRHTRAVRPSGLAREADAVHVRWTHGILVVDNPRLDIVHAQRDQKLTPKDRGKWLQT